MGQGSFEVWAIVWLPWLAVVLLDIAREPRDWRWLISLMGLGLVAGLTWGRIRDLEGRFAAMSALGCLLLMMFAWNWRSARLRRRLVRSWAESNGFQTVALRRDRANRTLPAPLCGLPMLLKTRWPRTDCVVSRCDESGQDLYVFDLRTSRRVAGIDSGDRLHAATVVAMRRPGGRLPLFQARPRALLARNDDGPFKEAIALARPSEFSRQYRLGGYESRNIAALFDEELAGALIRRPGWIIEGEGEWLAAMFYEEAASGAKTRGLRIASADRIGDHVNEASALLEMIADRADRRAYRVAAGA